MMCKDDQLASPLSLPVTQLGKWVHICTHTLSLVIRRPCGILQVGQSFGMSQNLGGNLSPSSKVSCFPGCWMAGAVCGRVPDTSGSDSAPKLQAWDVADWKDYVARTTPLCCWGLFVFCILLSSLASLCCNRYCTKDSFTFLWDILEIPLFVDEGNNKSFGVTSSIWHFLVPCFLPLIFRWRGAIWTCDYIPNCWGPKACVYSGWAAKLDLLVWDSYSWLMLMKPG